MKPHLDILIIDDDSDDISVFKEALDSYGLKYNLDTFEEWESASAHLDRVTDEPDIIVLDLNLPRTHGHEALAYIKANIKLRHIPVMVLSVSRNPDDSEKSFLLGAAGYFIKPVKDEEWNNVVQAISDVARKNQLDNVNN